jgi:hypothetical protein
MVEAARRRADADVTTAETQKAALAQQEAYNKANIALGARHYAPLTFPGQVSTEPDWNSALRNYTGAPGPASTPETGVGQGGLSPRDQQVYDWIKGQQGGEPSVNPTNASTPASGTTTGHSFLGKWPSLSDIDSTLNRGASKLVKGGVDRSMRDVKNVGQAGADLYNLPSQLSQIQPGTGKTIIDAILEAIMSQIYQKGSSTNQNKG